MLDKLQILKKCKDAARTEVILVVSESSCSDEDERGPVGDTHGPGAAADGPSSRSKPPADLRKTFSTRDIKIAPIFVHTARHSKTKRGRNNDEPTEIFQKPAPPPQREEVRPAEHPLQRLSTDPHLTEREGACKVQVSASDLQICLEDIQSCNPAFTVQTVFSSLQRKARGGRISASRENSPNFSSHYLKEKRKRRNESSERVPKRPRSGLRAEGVCHTPAQGVEESPVQMLNKPPRGNKLSRTHRLRQLSISPAGLIPKHHREAGPIKQSESGPINHTESDSQTRKIPDIPIIDPLCEDVIWTDKYSPQHSSEIIGNSASVRQLQKWLKKWKLRTDCEERRKMAERKKEAESNGSWDSGDFLGEEGEEEEEDEPLCNTMLITGPPGVGKTAAVYACAQELSFKVFEVNCSSQRNGHQVLSQLKEATQSHLVETSEKDPLKPTYFNNYSCTVKADALPGRTLAPKITVSSSKKRAAKRFGCSTRKGKTNPAAVTLANYFKMKKTADLLHSGGLSPSEKPDDQKSGNQTRGCDQRAPQYKNTATSLILFEEVDVIFDDDVGFLTAIRTFMTTTKRPVILTTNDPFFRERFKCNMEELIFKAPSEVNVCSYLQLVALAECVRLQQDDVSRLHNLFRGDVRRCLLQLQLYVKSGQAQASKSGGLPKESFNMQYLGVTDEADCTVSRLGRFGSGCTSTHEKLQNILQRQFWSEADMEKLLILLAESWRRAVPLLYSNLELLLPVRDTGPPEHLLDNSASPGLQNEPEPSEICSNIQQKDHVSASDSKSCRTISRLSRKKITQPVFDSFSSANLKNIPPKATSSLPKKAHQITQSSRDRTEKHKANLSTGCLDAMTNFFDLMSYIDATAPTEPGLCSPEEFVWTGVEIKDGMLDEMREEEVEDRGRSWTMERRLDFQAAVEGLGFHSCWQKLQRSGAQKYRREVGDTERGGLEERLIPPVSLKKQGLSFSFPALSKPSVSRMRYQLSRKVLCTKPFSLMGNRRAVSLDYMPTLRCISHHQRTQQQTEPSRRRRQNHLSRLGLSKSTIQLLAEDFS